MIVHSNQWGENIPTDAFDYNEGIYTVTGDKSGAILIDVPEAPALLKALREQAGLSQSQLGAMIYPDTKPATSGRMLRAIETGERKIGLALLATIVEKLGLKLSLAVSGFENFPKPSE